MDHFFCLFVCANQCDSPVELLFKPSQKWKRFSIPLPFFAPQPLRAKLPNRLLTQQPQSQELTWWKYLFLVSSQTQMHLVFIRQWRRGSEKIYSWFTIWNHFTDHFLVWGWKRLTGMKQFPRSAHWLFVDGQTIFLASENFKARQGIGDHLTNFHIFQMRNQNQRSSANFTRWHSVTGKAKTKIKITRLNIQIQLYLVTFFLLADRPSWQIISKEIWVAIVLKNTAWLTATSVLQSPTNLSIPS